MEASSFYAETHANGFDNLQVDVPAIFKHHPVESLAASPSVRLREDRFRSIYRSPLLPLKIRMRLWEMAFHANWDLAWFDNFNDYWTTVLGGRPLWSPQDVYFLKNTYRMKFQRNILPDTDSADVHLEAWQRPELLYFLLHLLTKPTSGQDVGIYKKALGLRGQTAGLAVMEYGCGLAPFTYHALRFLPGSAKNQFFPTDIAMLPFHYGAWRLRERKNVQPQLLKAKDNFQASLQEPMDIIFCIQVFEHMNEPLLTAKYFHSILKKGGVLVFDFILTDAQGLDSKQGTQQRGDVLEFIKANFKIASSSVLSTTHSLPLTYAIKN